MAPKSVALPSFGGLDLRDDPQEISLGAAIDCMNVDVDQRGRLRTRDGTASLVTQAAAFTALQSFGTQVVTADGTNLKTWSNAGLVVGTVANASTYIDVQAFGTPTFEGGYVALGTASAIRKVTSTGTWSAPAGMPSATYLARQDPDNRLVAAAVSGQLSRVQFSDAGLPETWGVNNFVDLAPGDGDIIAGIANYKGLLFVFKPSRFWVFYGNETDSSGNPVFSNRVVSDTVGAAALAGTNAAAAGRLGVYFIGRDYRVYRTSGSTPEIVSDMIDPWLRQRSTPYFTAAGQRSATPRIFAAAGRVFVVAPDVNSNFATFVFDEFTNAWTVYSWAPLSVVGLRDTDTEERPAYITNAAASGVVSWQSSLATTDGGTAISSSYRTGFWNPGAAGAESWVREVLLDGTGTVTVKAAVNDAVALGTGQAVTLGTTPAIAQGRDRRGLRGRNVSYQFSGTAPWQLSTAAAILWGQRSPGLQA